MGGRKLREGARGALRSADVRWALGLTALALVIRLVFVIAWGRTVTYDPASTSFAFNDTFFYSWTGAAISMGDGFSFLGHASAHWPPGYSVLLAGVYTVFGADTFNALVANAVLGAVTVALLYWIARRALGRPAAIASAAALAVFPGQILMGDVALAETFYAFELVAFLALVMALGRSWRALVVLGIVAGLSALTRGEGLLFPLIVLAFGWTRGERKVAFRHAALVAVVMALLITPWTIRNIDVAKGFVPVGGNASYTLWSGHNPRANGGPVYQTPAELAKLNKLSEAEAASRQRRDAVDWATSHPLRELELIPLKLNALARGDSLLIRTWIDAAGQMPLTSAQADLFGGAADLASYSLIVALLVSVILSGRALWRVPAMRAALAFIALAVPLYGFVYYGNVRYRIPLEPLMLLVVGAVAARVWEARASLGVGPQPGADPVPGLSLPR
jgi:4-amino-4-deoxy-L-arabinose transferase-like glycosyltransferase